MTFENLIKKLWNDHAEAPTQVMIFFDELITKSIDANSILLSTQLIAHVMVEHLGEFDRGIEFLNKLELLKINDSVSLAAIFRAKAAIFFTQDAQHNISNFNCSDQIRILTMAASSNANTNQSENALNKIKLAVNKALDLDRKDPVLRELAIATNNIASMLEDKSDSRPFDSELMIFAANTARKFWEISGTWVEVERAEYRLSQSFLKLKDYISSIKHANQCLTICENNKAQPLEFFFAYEAIAKVEKSIKQPLRSLDKMKHFFELLSVEDKKWCSVNLAKIENIN